MTLTRNLADAHGAEGIRVNQLNVGWTLTPNELALKIKEGLPEDWPSKVPKTFAPSGRLLSPADIAWAAVYFLSDEAALDQWLDCRHGAIPGHWEKSTRRKSLERYAEAQTGCLSRNATWTNCVSIGP